MNHDKRAETRLIGSISNHYSFYLNIRNFFHIVKFFTKEKFSKNVIIDDFKKIIVTKKKPYPLFKTKDIKFIFEEPFEFIDIVCLFIFTINNDSDSYLCVHNVNKWFSPKINRYRSLDLFEKIKEKMRISIVKKIKNIIVISPNVLEYCNLNIKTHNFTYIPFGEVDQVFIKTDSREKSQHIKVVIPGTINEARNYELIIEAITKFKTQLNTQYEFIFLGRPISDYGHRIQKKLNEIKRENITIRTFNYFISTSVFSEILNNSDLIFSIFDLNFKSKEGYFEILGQTKETGILFIGMNYCIPMLVPKEYNIPKEIKSQTLQFASIQHCIEILGKINPNQLFELRREAIVNYRKQLKNNSK